MGTPTIQIHTGPVKRLVETGSWFNVLDPELHVHLDQSKIARTWVVRKPAEHGVATSLELYDSQGTSIALLHGVRKPGSDGGVAWDQIASKLT